MPISLYAATIPTKLQILAATKGLLAKASESGLPETDLVEARLIDDMQPFAFQIQQIASHSKRAVEGIKAGVFTPDMTPPPATLSGLLELVEDAERYLTALAEDEVDSMVGREMRFEMGEYKVDFVAEEFLFTFVQPNFFFHVVTAYDILRAKGVKVGKMDYLGQMRMKG